MRTWFVAFASIAAAGCVGDNNNGGDGGSDATSDIPPRPLGSFY